MSSPARIRYEIPEPREVGPAFAQVLETGKAMVAEGQAEEAFEFALSALAAVLKKSRELEMLLAKLRRLQAGKTSERVDPGQLALLFEEMVAQLGEEAEEALDPEAEARADAEIEREIEEARAARGPGEPKPPRQSWRASGGVGG